MKPQHVVKLVIEIVYVRRIYLM